MTEILSRNEIHARSLLLTALIPDCIACCRNKWRDVKSWASDDVQVRALQKWCQRGKMLVRAIILPSIPSRERDRPCLSLCRRRRQQQWHLHRWTMLQVVFSILCNCISLKRVFYHRNYWLPKRNILMLGSCEVALGTIMSRQAFFLIIGRGYKIQLICFSARADECWVGNMVNHR